MICQPVIVIITASDPLVWTLFITKYLLFSRGLAALYFGSISINNSVTGRLTSLETALLLFKSLTVHAL